MIGENVFNPTQQRLLILVKPRLQKNPNNSLVVLATIHLLLDKTHPLAFLYIRLGTSVDQKYKQEEVEIDLKLKTSRKARRSQLIIYFLITF